MATMNELRWYAVDLDGTLAHKIPDYTIGDSRIGEPIAENVEKLRAVVDKGYKVVIHTSRHWDNYSLIEEWLDKHNIPYRGIVCGKLLAFKYVDDRAINADKRSWLHE